MSSVPDEHIERKFTILQILPVAITKSGWNVENRSNLFHVRRIARTSGSYVRRSILRVICHPWEDATAKLDFPEHLMARNAFPPANAAPILTKNGLAAENKSRISDIPLATSRWPTFPFIPNNLTIKEFSIKFVNRCNFRNLHQNFWNFKPRRGGSTKLWE